MKAVGYAADHAGAPLGHFEFERREPGANDVTIEILYCGVCHSDIHYVNNDWGRSNYPVVPGHEIVGRVLSVGDKVTRFSPGDTVGVGCFVDSCRHCFACDEGEEQFCAEGPTMTYGGFERESQHPTFGGYSTNYVVDEKYTLKISEQADLAATAPLLCAGITTWSPLKRYQVGPGQLVGVMGLGGLGHIGVKFAKAFGAEVVMFTTSTAKTEDAKKLGADHVVLSSDKETMKAWSNRLDFLLDTVSAPHDLNKNLRLLKRDGVCCLVGLPDQPLSFSPFMTAGRKNITGSMMGGIEETQEMLDFCAEHGIGCDVELIDIQSINTAYERVLKSDVKYRFVIDMASFNSDNSAWKQSLPQSQG
ncbi:NAD(P)-dependent alcohol dehydrogenase [Litorivivens sp.]|uniref:NAD(P)-dependent alcohol dehydrogenase n=1 Tax=Litorivivens sp. TaxID=2020868 RepID=UPI003569E171